MSIRNRREYVAESRDRSRNELRGREENLWLQRKEVQEGYVQDEANASP
jgi:hypothetical protein